MRWLAGGPNVMLATGAGSGEPARNMHWLFATAISKAEVQSIRPTLDRGAGQRGVQPPCRDLDLGQFGHRAFKATRQRQWFKTMVWLAF